MSALRSAVLARLSAVEDRQQPMMSHMLSSPVPTPQSKSRFEHAADTLRAEKSVTLDKLSQLPHLLDAFCDATEMDVSLNIKRSAAEVRVSLIV